MRVRTWSACVALAWGILLIMTAVGSSGPFRPAQANTRIASTISNISNTAIQVTLTGNVTHRPSRTVTSTAATMTSKAGTGTYVVQPGDSLSGIAAALGTSGGWPALYAANRQEIGFNPNAIRAGTVLAIPHPASPGSQRASSASPPVSRPEPTPTGTPSSAPATAPASGTPSAAAQPPAHASAPSAAVPSTPTSGRRHPRSAPMLTVGGLPRWLEIVLVAAGLLIATAFLTEPVLAIARRRAARPAAAEANIVLADYERLVVTHSRQDGTVYVLRPPDADPQAILLAARLVLGQDRYEALAGHLGVPAHWPRE
jgi:LysM repeat protein